MKAKKLDKFTFFDRKRSESSQQYWKRVIKYNLENGLSASIVADILGRIIGNKEKREGIDELTKLKTKKVFWLDLKEALADVYRQTYVGGHPKISLIILDLDDFKKINDFNGYLKGDKILRQTAKILKQKTRLGDTIARFGGEEFCLILESCSGRDAIKIAEKLRKLIEKIGVTASFGLAESLKKVETPEEFFNRANVACAIAKGRLSNPKIKGKSKNRVVFWTSDMADRLNNNNG